MKKLSLATTAAALLVGLSACNGGKLKEAEAQNQELRGDLQETLATQDSLFALFNDISDGLTQIKQLENIVTAPTDLASESQSRKDQIRDDMMAIQQALQQRRERLAELEAKLQKLNGTNSTLTKTISNLRAQINEQQTEIQTLTNKLAEANIIIEELGTKVADLNTSVDTLTTKLANERDKVELANLEKQVAVNNANRVYYAIGSKSELKAQKILETGFLKKDKVMEGDFDQNYFTTGDKTVLRTIALNSTKAKVLTKQPTDSYVISTAENGQKVLTITDPNRFWQRSNYLVVQTD